MVLVGFGLLVWSAWLGWAWWHRRDLPHVAPVSTPFLVGAALSGAAATLAMEAGWVVTEVGRQPWIVYKVELVSQAATTSDGVTFTLIAVLIIYPILTVATVAASWSWLDGGIKRAIGLTPAVPYGPPAESTGMIADGVVAVLWLVVTVYATTGGADFGGGVWDLLAGGDRRGAAPRRLIDRSIAPVWEANHVWLVIILVVLWTGFPPAFEAIMTTLFVPISVAAFGVLLRGSGFAFRSSSVRLRYRRLSGALFASSSLITPFFFGTVSAAIVTGKVHTVAHGTDISAWTTPTALVLGSLAVVAFAYLAAVYLTSEAERHDATLTEYFRRRALGSGILAGGLAALALYELIRSAPRVADHLTSGAGLGLLVASSVLGGTVLVALALRRIAGLRYLAAATFVAMLWGWAVAQYPAMLPGSLSIRAAAAPTASLVTELFVVGVICLIVVPSFLLLYRLSQRGVLRGDPLNE